MKPRRQPYGDKNICGASIERLRKERGMKQLELVAQMQLLGVDINPSSLSKLEGQMRIATDLELYAIARIFRVQIESLLTPPDVRTSESEDTPTTSSAPVNFDGRFWQGDCK